MSIPSQAELFEFRELIQRTIGPEEVDFSGLVEHLRVRSMGKGEFFLQEGEAAVQVGCILKGCMREFYILKDGTERTRSFGLEGSLVGSLSDLLSGRSSRAFISAEEDTVLMVFPFAPLLRLSRSNQAWERVLHQITLGLYLLKSEREYELLGLDAEARYESFLRRYPGLEERIAQRHIASYVGITPVHLSRLRRRRR